MAWVEVVEEVVDEEEVVEGEREWEWWGGLVKGVEESPRREDMLVLAWLLESVWMDDVCEVGERGTMRLRVGVACSRVMEGDPDRRDRSGVERDREILRRRWKGC